MSTIEQTKKKETGKEAGIGATKMGGGLKFSRKLTRVGEHPYDKVTWEYRSASITNDKGEKILDMNDVEIPAFWSQLATNVVVSKYFRSKSDTADRETSIRQIIDRVVNCICAWGRKDGYFASEHDAETFEQELIHILLHQMATFNSPVWFNVGIDTQPQASACFINSVDDTMESIMELAGTEAHLFKGGSGSGTNLSSIRSSRESLSTGGQASGPVSFMRGFDAFAGVIKSGGKTRRAAKMVILNAHHPDIREFIDCKVHEEKKAWALIDAGYGGDINGEAYNSVFFQNSNNSVRARDSFMEAVVNDSEYETIAVKTGEPIEKLRAKDIMNQIAEATHVCGDPGMQFDDACNKWHTCKASGRINASNPCSEYMFLDNSACNLASLNLMRFINENGDFDIDLFKHAVDIMITAQDIFVDNAQYPTAKIGLNSHLYRPLGLGYANLGALLMRRGTPYDSDAGRSYAAAITALMTGEAYAQSARMAGTIGPFEHYTQNAEPMLDVMQMHRNAVDDIDEELASPWIIEAAKEAWDNAIAVGSKKGFRNAQSTVLAPTGTIAFMMDCDTTGVEPDIALVKYKNLVGGGVLKIVNNSVYAALERLGYEEADAQAIVDYIDETGTIEGAPGMKNEHLPIFDCAFKAENGSRCIEPGGHIRMMAAVQPFISGAISKTVNMPTDATPQDIFDAYVDAWKLGLKAVAIYRDGSKRTQPLQLKEGSQNPVAGMGIGAEYDPSMSRRRLPDERQSITHKFDISGHEGYITAGLYDDGKVGEIFIRMAKEGSVVSGLMDSFATAISLALQYGVPLEVLVDKFSHTRFEPSGITRNPEIPIAKSIMDYIFRWMNLRFLKPMAEGFPSIIPGLTSIPPAPAVTADSASSTVSSIPPAPQTMVGFQAEVDAPPCPECGSIMVRNGSCHRCINCGSTSGCS
ncbi:MAG: vitamin B12-dependent ribonucleotide reductase [Deltaproteobacteria bacterium]|nr:vitamin B12-dependent ribonucleotide reductase [Deltaproteobacteria bacterium]MBN2674656.1 vitamin B12-dependent ribonucleotide reductase [Deltaproteobacteria bacterium]